jgi:hypothetical protein
MLIADMIHSCSNDDVAQAAVASIGGRFADRVRAAAARNGLKAGRFVSLLVRDFARRADSKSLHALSANMLGADQPLLCGLERLVEPCLDEETPSVARLDDDEELRRYGSSVQWAGPALLLQ